MKLSEALRIGAKLRPQAFGCFFEGDGENPVCSCALGAIYEATFGLPDKLDEYSPCRVDYINKDALIDDYPELILEVDGEELYYLISHLNDGDGMEREAIADWLESEGY